MLLGALRVLFSYCSRVHQLQLLLTHWFLQVIILHSSFRWFLRKHRAGFQSVAPLIQKLYEIFKRWIMRLSGFYNTRWINYGSRVLYSSPRVFNCQTTLSEVVTKLRRLPTVAVRKIFPVVYGVYKNDIQLFRSPFNVGILNGGSRTFRKMHNSTSVGPLPDQNLP